MRRACYVLIFVCAQALAGVNRWTFIGPQTALYSMAVDPRGDKIIYAAGYEKIWSTVDAGATWISTDVPTLALPIIRVAPSSPSTVYVLGIADLYRSTSSGTSWTHRDTPAEVFLASDMQIDAVQPNVLVVAEQNFCFLGCTGGGVYRSTDSGANWRLLGPKDTDIYQIALDPRSSQTIYANGGTKLFRTTNGGSSWQTITPPGSTAIRMVAIDPVLSRTVYAAAYAGVYRSDNSGTSWDLILQPNDQISDVSSIAVDSANGNHLIAAGTGAVQSVDGGRTWTRVGSGGPSPAFQIEIRGQSYIGFLGLPGEATIVGYTAVPPRRRAVRE